MYEVIRSVIAAGGYKLAEIQHKIKKMYILGDLDEGQMDGLLALAARGVSADAERPEMLELVLRLADRVEVLEKKLVLQEDSTGDGTAAYEAWNAWDGVSDQYQPGAVVSHNGLLWESVYEGQNVWEPGAAGTESMWVEYAVPEETEETTAAETAETTEEE